MKVDGVPFFSWEFVWFMFTNQWSLIWEMAVYCYPFAIPYLPPIGVPIPLIFMIIFLTDPDLFKNGDIDPAFVNYIKNFGYVLSMSFNTFFFQYEIIKPYDDELYVSYFIFLQLFFIFLWFFNNIFILGSLIPMLIFYFGGYAFTCKNCVLNSSFR